MAGSIVSEWRSHSSAVSVKFKPRCSHLSVPLTFTAPCFPAPLTSAGCSAARRLCISFPPTFRTMSSYTSMVLSNGLPGHQHVYTQHRGPYNQQHQHAAHVPPAAHPSLTAHSSAPASSATSSTPSSAAVTANQPLLPAVSLASLLGPALPPPSPATLFSFYSPPSADVADTYQRYFSSCRSRELTGHRKLIRCVRWNSNGTKLASGGGDGSIRVYTLQSATPPAANMTMQSADGMELKGHSNSAEFVCFDPSRPAQLASASLDGTVKIWDTNCQ